MLVDHLNLNLHFFSRDALFLLFNILPVHISTSHVHTMYSQRFTKICVTTLHKIQFLKVMEGLSIGLAIFNSIQISSIQIRTCNHLHQPNSYFGYMLGFCWNWLMRLNSLLVSSVASLQSYFLWWWVMPQYHFQRGNHGAPTSILQVWCSSSGYDQLNYCSVFVLSDQAILFLYVIFSRGVLHEVQEWRLWCISNHTTVILTSSLLVRAFAELGNRFNIKTSDNIWWIKLCDRLIRGRVLID